MLRYFKVRIAYDGTDYYGWQEQETLPTIAQKSQDIFAKVFNKKITLLGASRTDAGVHAMGQVAAFRIELAGVKAEKMLWAWNNIMPPEIKICTLEEMPEMFNPYKEVVSKTYWYHFFQERPLPHNQRYGWYYRYPIDLDKLKKCLEIFIGTHDFRSFCTGTDLEDTVRRIDTVSVEYNEQFQAYRIAITGPKFLRYMIRRIVGACIEVASRSNLSVDDIKKVLEAKDPEHCLPKAPAKGLMLHNIVYESEII